MTVYSDVSLIKYEQRTTIDEQRQTNDERRTTNDEQRILREILRRLRMTALTPNPHQLFILIKTLISICVFDNAKNNFWLLINVFIESIP